MSLWKRVNWSEINYGKMGKMWHLLNSGTIWVWLTQPIDNQYTLKNLKFCAKINFPKETIEKNTLKSKKKK